jgi:hypothetical protein
MTPELISKRVVVDRMAILTELLEDIRRLPLADHDFLFADRRNIWCAESCLRRSLEALLDIGRHILAKGFAVAVSEYKEVAARLEEFGVLSKDEIFHVHHRGAEDTESGADTCFSLCPLCLCGSISLFLSLSTLCLGGSMLLPASVPALCFAG